MSVFLITVLVLFVLLAGIHVWLGHSEDLSRHDHPVEAGGGESFSNPAGPSTGHRGVVEWFESKRPEIAALPVREMIPWVRRLMEDFPRGRTFDCRFAPVDADGIRCEWVLAPGVDPKRRVLYMHGGAFFAGSPNSHRTMTARFSELAGAAVLSVDYRLKPEHRRADGIADCRRACAWLLENGPEGPAPLSRFFVGGDSAGGNLALMISAWLRDRGMRQPDAVVAFSPVADCTFLAPSIRGNAAKDTLVRPLFGPLLQAPRFLLRWITAIDDRMRSVNPEVSPVFGDLSGLPPTLIQASESEMLFDDARRYVNKARKAGSPAYLQSWDGLLHAWPLFYPEVPEAGAAWQRVGEFLERAESGRA